MKNCFLILLLALIGGAAAAQTRPLSGPLVAFETRGAAVASDDAKFGAAELDLTLGYGVNRRLAFYLPMTCSVGLFNGDDRNYAVAEQIGAGIGYTPLIRGRLQLEICGKVGTTVHGSWKHVYYDGGLHLEFYKGVYVGAGVRYFSNYKGGFGNHCALYGALGVRLDFRKSHAR